MEAKLCSGQIRFDDYCNFSILSIIVAGKEYEARTMNLEDSSYRSGIEISGICGSRSSTVSFDSVKKMVISSTHLLIQLKKKAFINLYKGLIDAEGEIDLKDTPTDVLITMEDTIDSLRKLHLKVQSMKNEFTVEETTTDAIASQKLNDVRQCKINGRLLTKSGVIKDVTLAIEVKRQLRTISVEVREKEDSFVINFDAKSARMKSAISCGYFLLRSRELSAFNFTQGDQADVVQKNSSRENSKDEKSDYYGVAIEFTGTCDEVLNFDNIAKKFTEQLTTTQIEDEIFCLN